uniref:Uncharacterized protein n=1 Tax=Guillardia theta TaxID=55529 RepID=A0A7S4NGY1_GUITH|mmetsp:Transcript_2165/g.6592  ORF Transcript_2165/g.6592 Transcript_2165/m.6592 type:complete len:320 (+) Transcript_2165:578-1537(+)
MNGFTKPKYAERDDKQTGNADSKESQDLPLSAAPPKTVDKLLTTLRSAESSKKVGQCQGFATFKQKVIREGKKSSHMHQLNVTAFYDGSILPLRMQQKEGVHSHSSNTSMQSPFEMIFGFFCSRQQGSFDGLGTFDEISKANVSMSFSELLKFVSMMFPHHQFTRGELSWVMSRAKVEPIPLSESSKADKNDSDLKALTYAEWLNCVLRLALIAYGSQDMEHDKIIEHVAKDLMLDNVAALKKRLDRIARTNAGFGAWKDEKMPMEEGSLLSLNMKRPKALAEYMPDKNKMTILLVPPVALTVMGTDLVAGQAHAVRHL